MHRGYTRLITKTGYTKPMPRVATNTEPLTFEAYLELEEHELTRHEFVDGFMFAMAGASENTTLFL